MSLNASLSRGPVLLFGGSGQIGRALSPQLKAQGALVIAPERHQLDVADLFAVRHFLAVHQPAFIINAAAYTAVDRAETEPVLADAVNRAFPALLAEYAAQQQCRLLHYSSDYVYGDDGGATLDEQRPYQPQSIYAKSKALADQAVLAAYPAALILRTSWVYAAQGENFMCTMLRLLREKPQLQVVADQVGAPTPAALVAQVSLRLLTSSVSGVLNLASRGSCSWYQFARAIQELAIQQGVSGLCCQHISAIPSSAWPAAARRPLNSRLNVTALELLLGEPLPDWQSGLQQTFQQWLLLQAKVGTSSTPEAFQEF